MGIYLVVDLLVLSFCVFILEIVGDEYYEVVIEV